MLNRIQWLAENASMPQARAVSTSVLQSMRGNLVAMADDPHATLLAMEIGRFLERPAGTATMPSAVSAPPGAPIGQAPMDWLGAYGIGQPTLDWLGAHEPWCTVLDGHEH